MVLAVTLKALHGQMSKKVHWSLIHELIRSIRVNKGLNKTGVRQNPNVYFTLGLVSKSGKLVIIAVRDVSH